jgi:hypothetical protein
MSETMSESRGRNAAETCDYADCDAPTAVQDVSGKKYCHSDHHSAARNEWEPHELDAYDVEYDGVSGTYRAPSQEMADSQWKAVVRARRKE